MCSSDASSKNPFVKFKQHVDKHIGATFRAVLNIPDGTSTTRQQRDTVPNTSESTASEMAGDIYALQAAPSAANEMISRIDRWAQLSPYSPYNLQHLRQPRPQRDVLSPSHTGEEGFDFKDAYEDLLAISAGQSMMDLEARSHMKRWVQQGRYPHGEPSILWVERLHRQGLLGRRTENYGNIARVKSGWPPYRDVWGVGSGEQQSQQEPRTMDEWITGKIREFEHPSSRSSSSDDHHSLSGAQEEPLPKKKFINTRPRTDLARSAPALDNNNDEDIDIDTQWTKWLNQDIIINPAAMLRKAEEAVSNAERRFNDFVNANSKASRDYYRNHEKAASHGGPLDRIGGEPLSETDLFSALKSAFADADQSFGAFVKSVVAELTDSDRLDRGSREEESMDGATAAAAAAAAASRNSMVIGRRGQGPDGSKTETKTEGHVDCFGYSHQTTTTRTLNEQGEEVGRETRYSIRPATAEEHQQHQQQRSTAEDSDSGNWQASPSGNATVREPSRHNFQTEKRGWFWR